GKVAGELAQRLIAERERAAAIGGEAERFVRRATAGEEAGALAEHAGKVDFLVILGGKGRLIEEVRDLVGLAREVVGRYVRAVGVFLERQLGAGNGITGARQRLVAINAADTGSAGIATTRVAAGIATAARVSTASVTTTGIAAARV